MFLTVPETIGDMDRPDENQRTDLSARLTRVVTRDYGGVKQDAYRAAGLNSGTFDNALAGVPIAPRSLVKIVATFWPETEGDWKLLDPPLGLNLNNAEISAILQLMEMEIHATGEVTKDRYEEIKAQVRRGDFALAAAESDELTGEPGQPEE